MRQRAKLMLKNMSRYVLLVLGIRKKCVTYTSELCMPNHISQLIDIKRLKSGILMQAELNLRPSFLATVPTKTDHGLDNLIRGRNTTELLSRCLKITIGILGSTRQRKLVANGSAVNLKDGYRL